MATRQYIGARYVTKIYENSVTPGSAEWERDVTYEPLVMVTYQNSSYMSKHLVPSSIGNPADNPTFWVCTGYYNGQIASLQSQIGSLADLETPNAESVVSAINSIQKKDTYKNTVFLFDSYGEVGSPAISTLIPQYLGLSSDDYIEFTQGGTGFTNTALYQFLGLLYDNRSNIESKFDPDDVNYIVVEGGANDYGATEQEVRVAVESFCTHAKEYYPNATVIILFCGWSWNSLQVGGFEYNSRVLSGYNAVTAFNGKCIDAHNALHIKSLFSDAVHPTTEGAVRLARECVNKLLGGSGDVHYEIRPTLTLDTSVWSSGGTGELVVVQTIDNDVCSVYCEIDPADTLYILSLESIFDGNGYPKLLHLGTLSDFIIGNTHRNNVVISGICKIGSLDPEYNPMVHTELIFKGAEVYIRIGADHSEVTPAPTRFAVNQLGLYFNVCTISSARC